MLKLTTVNVLLPLGTRQSMFRCFCASCTVYQVVLSDCRHGLDVKAVTQAANEVAAVLEGDLPSSMELLDVG